MQKIIVTGADGLLGRHVRARMHAANCAARFSGNAQPYEIVACDRDQFCEPSTLTAMLTDADAVFHFAGVNRAPDAELAIANPAIAEALVASAQRAGRSDLHIAYANSTHSATDSAYGQSKRLSGEILADYFDRFTQFVLPHVFGEHARPRYNNVTATLIDNVIQGHESSINPDGQVELVHAGAVAQRFLGAFADAKLGTIRVQGVEISVVDLAARIQNFHNLYLANIVPEFSGKLDVDLFNCYRSATYPQSWPRNLGINSDARGALFEAIKSEGRGQVFLSTTHPAITRGNHFHLRKIERFLVIQGDAVIRMRNILDDEVHVYPVSGERPAFVDMPTLYTHSIENVGHGALVTLFWTNEFFDPADPDTYADMVIQ